MHERRETNEVSANVYVVIPPLNSPQKISTTTNTQLSQLWLYYLGISQKKTNSWSQSIKPEFYYI